MNLNNNNSAFNYALVYSIFPLLSCYIPLLFKIREYQAKRLINSFINGLIFISIIIIIESLIKNILFIDIMDYLPHKKINEGISDGGIDSLLVAARARGFSTEPIIAALAMSLGLNYHLIKLRSQLNLNGKINKKNFIIIIIKIFLFSLALLLTGSSAGAICSLFIIFLIFCLSAYKWIFKIINGVLDLKKVKVLLFFISVATISLILLLNLLPESTLLLEDLIGKISLNKDYSSVDSRLQILSYFYNQFLNNPLGISGYVGSLSSVKGSAINWYFTLLGDSGLLGTFFTLVPLSFASYLAINHKGISLLTKIDQFLILLTPIIGLLFHGTFYASLIWPLIIVIYCL